MKIVEITDDNVDDYEGLLDAELLVNIGREYHRGLVVEDEGSDDISSALFWVIKNQELHDMDTISEILELFSKDPVQCEEMLKVFDEKTRQSGAEKAMFEFDGPDEVRDESLKDDDFKVRKGESRDIIVTVGDFAKLPFVKTKPPEYIKSLSDITERQFKNGIMTSVLHGRYGLLDDLPFLPMRWFDPELSSCVITDDKITGFLLVRRIKEGIYRVELLYALQPDARINLLNMIRASIRAAVAHRSADDRIILRRHSDSTDALVKMLFPGKKGEQVIQGDKTYENS